MPASFGGGQRGSFPYRYGKAVPPVRQVPLVLTMQSAGDYASVNLLRAYDCALNQSIVSLASAITLPQ